MSRESMCIAPHIGCLIFSVVSFGTGFLFCFPSAQASHVISASVGSGIVRRNSRPVARFLSAISFSLVRLTWPQLCVFFRRVVVCFQVGT